MSDPLDVLEAFDNPAVPAVEKAMSDAFRRYTGTSVGQEMWNLNMERTWALVAPAAVDAARPHIEAAALRTAADALTSEHAARLPVRPSAVAAWLRDRADRIEQGAMSVNTECDKKASNQ
jgi:hypothetical protein